MSVILGINAFHADSAACLLVDGKLVGAVAEERLGSREKHTSRFPANAVRHLLSSNGVRLSDVQHLAIARNTSANRRAKMAWVLANPLRGSRAAIQHFRRTGETLGLTEMLAEICGEDPTTLRIRITPVEHHLAHISSAFYPSPFETLTAGFSYDASGDFASAMAARCQGSSINVIDSVRLPDSLGIFYTALCQFIGFDRFGEEYKVMGLAPYGEDRFRDLMADLVRLPPNGWFKLGRGYFGMHEGGESGALDTSGEVVMGKFYSDALRRRLGDPAKRGEMTQREKDIARSTQVRFEEAAIHCLMRLHRLVPSEQLVMAGGCALNGVANARILRDTPFRLHYLQPAASDDGTCVGAAFWVWHNVVGSRQRFHMAHAFWGPEHSDEACRKAVDTVGYDVEEFATPEALVPSAAKLIADGAVVGWYQGRSEWGPRALGNRSILANPAIANMKEIINAKIKRRESFRPFAPSVLAEDVATYFEQDIYSPFMMHVVKVRPEYQERLPAITHVDGTGRLQSVSAESNALYHCLITEVKKHTGFGVLLNTSFNENEPIVDTPSQAFACFARTEMDALALGRFLIRKKSQARI